MTSITQTVPNYFGGISEQPDYIKTPGQVKNIVNGIPDLTQGLYKRPGSKRIGTDKLDAGTGGSWFHYYRDAIEGSYIGRVDSNGAVKVWGCNTWTDNITDPSNPVVYNAGREMTVAYSTDNSGTEANLKAYLASTDSSDIKFLTINDTTFVNNKTKEISMDSSAKTTDRPHKYAAFIELIKTENGRQYSLNINSNENVTTINTATRIEIDSHTQPAAGSPNTGHCPGNGTKVFSVNSGGNTNLVFRLLIRGSQGPSTSHHMNNDDAAHNKEDYGCTYVNEITLLHGGEGWTTSSTKPVVTLEGYDYTIGITDYEATKAQANLKAVRPAPTPFDSDTAVSATAILGGIASELDGLSNISYTIIGNGIYLYSDSVAFNVQVVENDLMKVITREANDVSDLPLQCKNGYIVKIANTESEEDDYYMKFNAENGVSGRGSWVECAKPDIQKSFDLTNMPVTLERTNATTFTVKRFTWQDRDVGDEVTNSNPSFIGRKISRILFWRNRLVFLAGKSVVLSRPGDFGNFWINTALTVSASDPLDVACSTTFPSTLLDGIEMPNGLLIFSSDQQFLLTHPGSILNTETVQLVSVSTYNYNEKISPISLGQTISFIDNSGQYSRLFEMANMTSAAPPTVVDLTKVIPTTLKRDIDLLANSRENSTVFIGKAGEDIVHCYRYYNVGDRRIQTAWFNWKLNEKLKYHFVIGDQYYFIDEDNFLQQISMVRQDSDLSIDQDGVNYSIHLDNWTTVSNGIYDRDTNKTTFTNQSDWIDNVASPNGKLVVIDTVDNYISRYSECTVINNDDFTLPGNWGFDKELVVQQSNVDTSNNLIENKDLDAHGLSTGDPIRYRAGSTAIAGLTDGTVYYAVPYNTTRTRLATTLANANANTTINLTSTGVGIHRFEYVFPTLNIGYLYDYQVDFPKMYPTKAVGGTTVSDISASLVLHRVKLGLGKIGLYESVLSRVGKKSYTELIESSDQDSYDASEAPYLEEKIKTIPVYEKNTNINLTIKSTHPSPATIRSLSWEGDYTSKFYKRT